MGHKLDFSTAGEKEEEYEESNINSVGPYNGGDSHPQGNNFNSKLNFYIKEFCVFYTQKFVLYKSLSKTLYYIMRFSVS